MNKEQRTRNKEQGTNMARVTITTLNGMDIMLHGKIGDVIYKVHNGKQIVTAKPRQRSTPLSEKEIEIRRQFAVLSEAISLLTPEQWDYLRKEWQAAGRKFRGKTYSTLRGYTFARLHHEWM